MAEEAPGSGSKYFGMWETRGKALKPMSDQRCLERHIGAAGVASIIHVVLDVIVTGNVFADGYGSGDVGLAPATAAETVAVAAAAGPVVLAAVAAATAAEYAVFGASRKQMAYCPRAVAAAVAVAQKS